MPYQKSITFKLISLILISTGLIVISIFFYSYLLSRKIILNKIKTNALNHTHSIAFKIDSLLIPLEKIPQNFAFFLEKSFYPLYKNGQISPSQELFNILREIIKKNPEVFGFVVAFEPYSLYKNKKYFAPYFFKKDGKIHFTYIQGEDGEYFLWDWYQLPKILQRPVWSEPYYEKDSGILMSTYSVPFYKIENGERKFLGVVAINISLTWLQNLISSIKIANSGYGFLLSKNGTFIIHPKKQLIMNETIFSIAEEKNNFYLRKIGKDMIHGKEGIVTIKSIVTGKKCFLCYTPLSNQWSLGILFPEKELMADLLKLNRDIFLLLIVGLLFISCVIILISKTITKPLKELTSITRELGKGNLDIEIPGQNLNDEVGQLAKAFDYMKKALKKYIQNLQETTAAKQRVESELKIAADIQLSMLPRIFPPFPDREEFDIFAIMEPAKEVGGDFYDFFFIDENRLCFLIADVSGKGVPASLFMAILKFLLKTEAMRGIGPDEILNRVNATICPENKACMFATLFCGILNIKTGEIIFSNAGHNPPLLWKCNGKLNFLNPHKGFVLGVMDNVKFKKESLLLKPDDILILYTDGVTEAMNEKNEQFTKQRLFKIIKNLKNRDVKEITYTIRKNITSFVGKALQSDDITILVLKFNKQNS